MRPGQRKIGFLHGGVADVRPNETAKLIMLDHRNHLQASQACGQKPMCTLAVVCRLVSREVIEPLGNAGFISMKRVQMGSVIYMTLVLTIRWYSCLSLWNMGIFTAK